MSIARKVVYNTVVQFVGRLFGLVVMLVTLNAIANYLVVDGSALTGYGQYSIVFAYISIIGATADLGMFTLVVREISQKSREEASRVIGNAIGFRIALMVLVFAVMGLAYPFLPYEPIVKQGILVGVFVAFSMLFSQVVATIFQATLSTGRVVLSESIGKLTIAVLTIIALKQGYGLLAVVLASLLGNIITLLINTSLARGQVKIAIKFNLKLWRQNFSEFSSIAIIAVLGLIHFKIDTLLLSFFKPPSEVGIYALAYKILEVIVIIPAILSTNLLPVLTKLISAGDELGFKNAVEKTSVTLVLIATVITVLVFPLAPWLITFIAQPDFLAAAAVLRVLVIAAFFVFITTLFAQALISTKKQKLLINGYIGAVVINIVLNLIVIPRFSYMGAAYVTLLTELLLLVYTVVLTENHLNTNIRWRSFIKIMIGGLVAVPVVGFLSTVFLPSPIVFHAAPKLAQATLLFLTALGGLGILWALLAIFFRGNVRVWQHD
jgi:O-antigen/teichoic acid export membrane protein